MSQIGTFVMIELAGKLLVGQTSASLKDTITMIETSNKTTGNSSTFVAGRTNTTISVSGIASSTAETTNTGFHELRVLGLAGTAVTITLAEFSDKEATTEVIGTTKYTGSGLTSGLTWDLPDNDKQTFSCDLQISGDLTPAAVIV